jgi:hypothetical protein
MAARNKPLKIRPTNTGVIFQDAKRNRGTTRRHGRKVTSLAAIEKEQKRVEEHEDVRLAGTYQLFVPFIVLISCC